MQVTEYTEADETVRRVGVQEQFSIQFRPSPNFKNMKKFMKSRIDCSETNTLGSPLGKVISAQETPPSVEKVPRKEIKPVVLPPQSASVVPRAVAVQPPLPPYPPPESPPLNINIKQEKQDEDDEIENNTGEEHNLETQPQPPPTENQSTEPNPTTKPKKTMCKEFIRGNCKRAVCKFAHEVDVSQLAGVFTFCWNYQNDVCNVPNCRFVHASVFEEAEFYRTGVLPPHARSHLKKQEPQPQEELQPKIRPASFATSPPLDVNMVKSMEQNPDLDDFRNRVLRGNSHLKRSWTQTEVFSPAPSDLEPNHMAKKCKTCEVTEISLKNHKEKYDTLFETAKESRMKLGLLTKKNNKLYKLLFSLLNPTIENKPLVSLYGDKENSLLERLNGVFGTQHRMSPVNNDDSLKNILGYNFDLSNIQMAKLLCSIQEHNMASTSRET